MRFLLAPTRISLVTAVLASLLAGCSGSSESMPTASETPAGETTVAATPVGAAAATTQPVPPRDADQIFNEDLARLMRSAQSHESRQYFDMALEARREIAAVVNDRFGPNSWQAKSAASSLKFAERLVNAPAEEQAKLRELVMAQRNAAELRERGTPAEALAALERTTEIAKEIVGVKHPVYGNLLGRQAELWVRQGQYAAALRIYPEALAIAEESFGRNHPEPAAVLHDWGTACRLEGDVQQAESLLTRALEMRHQSIGSNHPDYAATLYQLGATYHAQRKFEQSAPLLEQALGTMERVAGRSHPVTLRTLQLIGMTHVAKQNYSAAEPLLKEVVDGWKSMSGLNSQEYAEALHALGILYGNQGRYSEAEAPIREALAILERILPADHPTLKDTQASYSALLRKVDRVADAEALESRLR